MKKQNKLYQNASIVTGLSIAERGLGFLYRIVLSRFIGAEGVGLYQVALSHFFLLHTVGAGGLPVTVSRFITRCNAEGKIGDTGKTVGAGLSLSLIFTLPICLIFLCLGDKMHLLFPDKRVFSLLKILLLVLPFSCLFEVIRASFWGDKKFLVPALLETAEEVATVLVGVALLLFSLRNQTFSAFFGAKQATVALVVAYTFSFACAVVCFICSKRKLKNPTPYLKPLFGSAMPITAVRFGASLVNSAVAVLLPAMLMKAGITATESMKIYGVLTGMVMPILSLPITVISGLSLVLMPELSNDYYAKNYQKLKANINKGVGFSFLLSCVLIPFFFALGKDMGGLAYSNLLAGEMISKGCLLVLPMSVSIISTSVLNSLGKEKLTFLFYFLGAGCMLALLVVLTPIFHGYAYLIALFVNFCLTAVCNLLLLKKMFADMSTNAINGKKRRKFAIFAPLLGILPISLLGQFCISLLNRAFSGVVAVIVTALVMAGATALWYYSVSSVPRETKKEFHKDK